VAALAAWIAGEVFGVPGGRRRGRSAGRLAKATW
jgi:hypothetical protein